MVELMQDELQRDATVLNGRYTIMNRIAISMISAVYRARRNEDGAVVALKVLEAKAARRPNLVARLHNEVRLGYALRDVPAIVPPLEHGQIPELGGRPFIAFEYLAASDIGTVRDVERLAFTPERACAVARDVADALVQLHARGVIHRDIKPTNIIVADGRVRLLDLGFAHSVGDGDAVPSTAGLTTIQERTGTLEYMAPEHILGQAPTVRFDVYGLAGTLWRLLAGSGPCAGLLKEDIIRRKCDPTLSFRSILNVRPKLDPEIAALVDRGMQRDPADRITSAEEFRDALDRILARLREPEVVAVPAEAEPPRPVDPPRPRRITIEAEPPSIEESPSIEQRPRAVTERQSRGEPSPKPRARERGWMSWPMAMVGLVAVAGLAWLGTSRLRAANRIEEPEAPEPETERELRVKPEAMVGIPVEPRQPAEHEPIKPEITVPPAAAEPALEVEPPVVSEPKTRKPRAIKGTVPPKPPEVSSAGIEPSPPDHCDAKRAEAHQAHGKRAWQRVIDTTDDAKCWPDSKERATLRAFAFYRLGRYGDCIEAGASSNVHAVELCRQLQERAKSP